MSRAISLRKNQSGFTLIEMVVVVILLGIMSVTIANYVTGGVQAYITISERDDLSQQGRFAVERVSRELRNALPGSVRVFGDASVQCLEFVPITGSTTYISDLTLGAANDFQVANFALSGAANFAAVLTLSQTDVYGGNGRVQSVAIVDPVNAVTNERRVRLYGPTPFSLESPERRVYFFSSPVSFCVRDIVDVLGQPFRELTRHNGYGLTLIPVTRPGTSTLLAEHIRLQDGAAVVSPFVYQSGTTQNNGVVHLDFRFMNRTAEQEWIRFSHEVFLRNTP